MSKVIVHIDTKNKYILYRDYIIEEGFDGWKWAHESLDMTGHPETETRQTIFECIEDIDAWLWQKED